MPNFLIRAVQVGEWEPGRQEVWQHTGCHSGSTGCRHFCLKSLNHGAVGSGGPASSSRKEMVVILPRFGLQTPGSVREVCPPVVHSAQILFSGFVSFLLAPSFSAFLPMVMDHLRLPGLSLGVTHASTFLTCFFSFVVTVESLRVSPQAFTSFSCLDCLQRFYRRLPSSH